MNDLLTTRQVQDILKVDRITVYRMLHDGRLQGVKIGQQWRFPTSEIDRLVEARTSGQNQAQVYANDLNFPTHCVQAVQDLFSEVGRLSALVIDMNGNRLTEISQPTRFAKILMTSSTGQTVSQSAWPAFAAEIRTGNHYLTCPFGLHYIGAPINEKDTQIGVFLIGQFYWQPPNPREEAERIHRLASTHRIDPDELAEAAREVPILDPDLHESVEAWPLAAATAVGSVLKERTGFITRLQQIANLTQI